MCILCFEFYSYIVCFQGSGQMNILALLTLSLIVRAIWAFCIVDYSPTLYSMRLIDRISILLQLSAVSVLVLGWGQAVNVDRIVRERTKLAFISLNVILYIFTFATGFADEGYDVETVYCLYSHTSYTRQSHHCRI